MSATTQPRRNAKKVPQDDVLFDRELEDLPPELRWREWMLRVEAVIFASAEPVTRETLSRVIGKDCSIDLLIDDLVEELRDRPYELVSVAGGWQHRTRPRFAETIRASSAPTRGGAGALSEFEAMVLMAVGYCQPVTRGQLSNIFGKEVSRDTIAALRGAGFLSSGPRSPTPGAPYTYVTTKHFLAAFGMETLRDLPNIEALEDAGLLSRKGIAEEVQPDADPEARFVDIPPDTEDFLRTGAERMGTAFEQIGDKNASTVKKNSPHPLMHRTESIDYGIDIEGELTLVLDEGETLLKPGCVVIQRGTIHAWANRSGKMCRILFVLVSGAPSVGSSLFVTRAGLSVVDQTS